MFAKSSGLVRCAAKICFSVKFNFVKCPGSLGIRVRKRPLSALECLPSRVYGACLCGVFRRATELRAYTSGTVLDCASRHEKELG